MIKLTNQQISGFNSPVIEKLLNSEDRQFPVDDAFRLADAIQQIQVKLKIYLERARKLIESCNGTIDGKGFITYPTPEDQRKATAEMEKLNGVEVEIQAEALSITKDWPKLNLQEALVLKPLISTNGGKDGVQGEG